MANDVKQTGVASLLMAASTALQAWFASRLVGLRLVGPKMRGHITS